MSDYELSQLEIDILGADLRKHNIPVTVKEIKAVAEDVKQLRADLDKVATQASMNANDISRLTGHLIGHEGSGGGVLDRLEKGQETLLTAVESIKDSMKGMTNMHLRDVNELGNKITENSTAIEHVSEKLEDTSETIDGHIKNTNDDEKSRRHKKGARQWDLVKSMMLVLFGSAVSVGMFYFFGVG